MYAVLITIILLMQISVFVATKKIHHQFSYANFSLFIHVVELLCHVLEIHLSRLSDKSPNLVLRLKHHIDFLSVVLSLEFSSSRFSTLPL